MKAAAERPPWQNPRIISTLLLVFLAGAASGALWMELGFRGRQQNIVSAASREPAKAAVLEKFRTELSLSNDQSDKIAMVLQDYQQYYQSLQDQLDDLRSTGKSRILQILNPDQRVKFEQMMVDLAPQLQDGNKPK